MTNQVFIFRVQVTGGTVQDQEFGASDESSGNGNALLLASRHLASSLSSIYPTEGNPITMLMCIFGKSEGHVTLGKTIRYKVHLCRAKSFQIMQLSATVECATKSDLCFHSCCHRLGQLSAVLQLVGSTNQSSTDTLGLCAVWFFYTRWQLNRVLIKNNLCLLKRHVPLFHIQVAHGKSTLDVYDIMANNQIH